MINLNDKVALVTGSSRGIGKACALRLAEAGADVVINFVTSGNEAEKVAEQITSLGRRAACVRADVSQEEDGGDLGGGQLSRQHLLALGLQAYNLNTQQEQVRSADGAGFVLLTW